MSIHDARQLAQAIQEQLENVDISLVVDSEMWDFATSVTIPLSLIIPEVEADDIEDPIIKLDTVNLDQLETLLSSHATISIHTLLRQGAKQSLLAGINKLLSAIPLSLSIDTKALAIELTQDYNINPDSFAITEVSVYVKPGKPDDSITPWCIDLEMLRLFTDMQLDDIIDVIQWPEDD